MARAISFNYDQAIDNATRLFWRDGYSGASLRELLKVMGIGEGSFYNTIRSKKNLYMECIKRYSETEGKKRAHALSSAPNASLGVRALFKVVLDCLDNPKTPSRLCMSAGMLSEDVLTDSKLRKFTSDRMSLFLEHLTSRLEGDRKSGLLPAQFDATVAASVIITYLQGMWRMAMVSYDRARLEKEIDILLKGLEL